MKHKLLSLAAALALCLSLCPAGVFAEETGTTTVTDSQNYIIAAEDGGCPGHTFTGTASSVTIVVNGGAHNITFSDLDISNAGSISLLSGADVNLKLEETNRVGVGIYVPTGSALTIDGPGSLTVTGETNSAGIGGGLNYYDETGLQYNKGTVNCGSITINGGSVTATGGKMRDDTYAPGIGGGYGARDNGSLTIASEEVAENCSFTLASGGRYTLVNSDPTGDMIEVDELYYTNQDIVLDETMARINTDNAKVELFGQEFTVQNVDTDGWTLQPLTITEAGTYTATFKNGDKSITKDFIVSACRHESGVYIDAGSGYHTGTCDVCGETVTLPHTNENGTCPGCGAQLAAELVKGETTAYVTAGDLEGEFNALSESKWAGATVTLLSDVTFTGDGMTLWAQVLNMNGHTINGTVSSQGTLASVLPNGMLFYVDGEPVTLTDGQTTLTGTITMGAPRTVMVTDSSGKITYFANLSEVSQGMETGDYTVTVLEDTTKTLGVHGGNNITLNGAGNITTEGECIQATGGTLTVDLNGTVTATGQYGTALSLSSSATVILKQGTFAAPDSVYGTIYIASGGTLGDLLYSDANGAHSCYSPAVNESATVAKGTVSVTPCTGTFAATDNGGGTHTRACDECGRSVTEDHTLENGKCTVCGARFVAEVTIDGVTTQYTKFEDVWPDVLGKTATITLLSDVTLDASVSLMPVDSGANITFVGGSYTLAGEGLMFRVNGGTLKLNSGTFTTRDGLVVDGSDYDIVDVLPNGCAFYQGTAPVALTDGQNKLPAGTYTVKECGHEGAGYAYESGSFHQVTCSACGMSETEFCTFKLTGSTLQCKLCDTVWTFSEESVPKLVYNGTNQGDAILDAGFVCDKNAELQKLFDFFQVPTEEYINAGTYTITCTGYDHFFDEPATFDLTFTIAPATLTASGTGTASGTYGQKLSELEVTGLSAALNGTPVGGTWTLEDGTVPDAGEHTCTAVFTAATGAGNYARLTAPAVQVTIHKADYTQPPAELSLTYGTSKTLDLSTLIPEGGTLGVVTQTDSDGIFDRVTQTDTSLTITLGNDEALVTKSGTLTAPVTGCKNYKDFELTIRVTCTDKRGVDIEGVAVQSRPYNGQPLSYTGTPTAKLDGETVPVSGFDFHWDRTGAGVGTYTLRVSVKENDPNYTGSVTLTASITLAQITITAPSQTIKAGEAVPEFTAADCDIHGLVGADQLKTQPTVSYASTPDTSQAGTVAVNASGAAVPDGGNYKADIIYVPGRLTIEAPSKPDPVDPDPGPGPVDPDPGPGPVDPDPGPGPVDPDPGPGPVDPNPGPVDPNPPQPGGEDIEVELKVEPGISEVPPALQNDPNLNTPAKLEAAMQAAITQISAGIPSRNVAVYDVTLMVSFDGGQTWTEANESNFPASGRLTVTLPYPAGTDRSDQFTVAHMFTSGHFGHTPGTVEHPAVTNAEAGIRFVVTGLSPISVGWTKAAPVEPDRPVTPSRPSGGSSGGGNSVSSYAVTVTRTTHGKVVSNRTRTASGSTVTLTVTPDSGYLLDTLTVTDSQGNQLRLTAQNGGTYTFTMPSRSVTVSASFVPAQTGWRNPYIDVAEGAWYYDAVRFVVENQLMKGYTSTRFSPDSELSRAQLAQILYNRAGSPAVTGGSGFADVASGAWYADAVAWAAANGIVSGYGDGRFGPDDPVTREQLAVMLWGYVGNPAPPNLLLAFPDASTASGYALDALRWAVDQGAVSGYSDGRLAPQASAARAQVAQILKNLFG